MKPIQPHGISFNSPSTKRIRRVKLSTVEECIEPQMNLIHPRGISINEPATKKLVGLKLIQLLEDPNIIM